MSGSADRRGPSGTLCAPTAAANPPIVESRGAARLDELSTILGVSQGDHSRDLDELAADGAVRRVHGGAVADRRTPERTPLRRQGSRAAAEKERIAARALELLAPDDTVYLDSGTTVLRRRPDAPGVGSPDGGSRTACRPATELAGRGPRLIVVGGEFGRASQALSVRSRTPSWEHPRRPASTVVPLSR